MNKAINSMLENVRARLMEEPQEEEAKPPLGSGKRFDALVAKLKKRKDVKDPAALAAWIGRKKYGKKRFAALAKEDVDFDELLVFEDVEDVIAFVEGLETLTEDELGEALDHSVMGAYRRAEPKEAPRLYGQVQKAAKAYLDFLQRNVQKERDLQAEFIFAAQALKKSIEDSRTQASAAQSMAMPGTFDVWHLIRSGANTASLIQSLKSLLKSDEMKIGSSKVRA